MSNAGATSSPLAAFWRATLYYPPPKYQTALAPATSIQEIKHLSPLSSAT